MITLGKQAFSKQWKPLSHYLCSFLSISTSIEHMFQHGFMWSNIWNRLSTEKAESNAKIFLSSRAENIISWIFSNNLNYSNIFKSSKSVFAFHFVLFTIKKVQLTIPMCYLIYFMADYNKIIEWFSCCVFMFCFLYETMCVFWFGFNYINPASDVEKYNLRKVVFIHLVLYLCRTWKRTSKRTSTCPSSSKTR